MKIIQHDNRIEIVIQSAQYSEDVLYKCFYWYTNQFTVNIEMRATEYIVSLRPLSTVKPHIIDTALEEKIARDLVDFKLRDIVTKETQVVRELIIAKAFAHSEQEEVIEGQISDPVGFNPNILITHEQHSISQ